jgi:hypothetical protein
VSSTSGRGEVKIRIVAATILALVLAVALAALGYSSPGKTRPSAVQYKITICHHTHSTKNPEVTISISNTAWPAHQKHGDDRGACAKPPAAAASAASTHGQSGQHDQHGKGGQHDQHGKGHAKK